MDFAAFAMIAAGAVAVALPLLLSGPHPMGHDLFEHMIFCRRFTEQFWNGELYPRWLVGVNHGLGSPTFFVFPPFQAFVYALLDPVTRTLHLNTLVVEDFLIIFSSGVCAFVWLRTLCERQIAIALAVLYMLAPYHLEIDYYRRAALSECWALAWIPLLMLFTTRIIERRRFAILYFALVFAVLILSHLVSVVIIALVPIAAAIYLPGSGERLRSLRGIVGGMLLGTGLSSFYLIPAVDSARYFPTSRFADDFSNFLISRATLSSHFAGTRFIHIVTRTGVDAILVCVASGLAAFFLRRAGGRKNVIFWLAVSAIPAFMICGVSAPAWRHIPLLVSAVQYPFRLNIVLCVAGVALLALLLSGLRAGTRPANAVRAVVALIVALPWAYSWWTVWVSYRTDPNIRTEVATHEERFVEDGWFLNWTAPGTDQEAALRASVESPARFEGAAGSIRVVSWAPRHIELATSSATGGELVVNQFYYPRWKAAIAGSTDPITVKAAMPSGLMEVAVPPGEQQVRLDLPISASEHTGWWVGALSMLLFGVIAWREKRTSRRA